jgi:hypothetical protein
MPRIGEEGFSVFRMANRLRPDDQSAKTFSEIKTIQNRSGGEQVKVHAQFGWDLPINLRSHRNRLRTVAEYPVEKYYYPSRISIEYHSANRRNRG